MELVKGKNVGTNIEEKTIDNIIEKLTVYMDRNNQTMHGLATTMGFSYQPFYRLMTKKSLPTITSLASISKYLNCTISQLTDENIFLDIKSFDSIANYLIAKSNKNIRISLSYTMLRPQLKDDFFAIQNSLNNSSSYQVFSSSNRIDIDGYFLVKYMAKIFMLEVLSVSRAVITAKYENKVLQIPMEELEVFAKFFCNLELCANNQDTISGVTI